MHDFEEAAHEALEKKWFVMPDKVCTVWHSGFTVPCMLSLLVDRVHSHAGHM